MRYARVLRVFSLVVCFLLLASTVCAVAQQPDDRPLVQPPDQQRLIADRFFEVLLRRPRPGTALDRVYSYHVQNQSMDEFMASLDVTEDVEQAGERQMVLGMCQARRGNSSLAIQALKKADAWLPDDAMASYQLAKAMIADGKATDARPVLERAIQRRPSRTDAPDIYLDLGRMYLRSGQSEKALAVWKQLTDQFPGDLAIAEKVATALADEQQLEAALDQFNRLVENAKTADTRIGYQIKAAELVARLGEVETARMEFQTILDRLRPGSWLHT
ncbi:MAG: tetratricopeptide repeat protein, partial [Planctomycetales bacterium]|nr:tetratricopeptide repeat protein [Planctomycetales bacterium]